MNKYVILAAIGVFVATGCKQSGIEIKDEFRQGAPIEVALSLSLEQTQAVVRSEPTTIQYSGGGFDAEITTEPIDLPTGKAVDDLAIANVWVLQFDGTTNDAKLIQKSYVENYIAGSTVELLKATAANRVAVVANTFDATWATSFALHSATWATVSAKSKSVATQSDVLVPNGGTDYLPMSGTVSGTLAVGATLHVPLIRTVAKVVVQLKSGDDLNATELALQLCGVPNATAWFPDRGTGVWPASPTAIDYGVQNVAGITTTGFVSRTFWVPVNRRGSVSGTTSFVRAANAPAGATYLGVSAGGWAYKVHLGGDFATDYNLRANTAYTYSLVFHTDLTDVDDRVTDVRALGALAQSPANDLAAAGATVTVSSPNAPQGLAWSAALSNTTGFALGAVTGSGATGSVPVVVGVNPTNAVRSSVFTATASNGQASSIELRQAASTMGALTQTPTNNIVAAGAVVAVTTPKATAGLAWTAALSNTTGFTLGKVSGSGVTGSVSVTVGVNPTNAVRSSTLTATATGGNTAGTVVISQAASSLNYTSLSATTPAAGSATSVSFTVTGTVGLTLSFAKSSGDGAFSAPSPATLTCDGSAQTVTVATTANTGAARQAVYSATVTNAGASGLNLSGITVKQVKGSPANSVEIGDLYWATGNLVASGNNSCKIGAPTDYGVYFKFGSLVGWSGGASGNGVGTGSSVALAVQVKPAAYSGSSEWTTVGRYTGGTAEEMGYSLPTTDAPTTGVGDPCRYYLGSLWRTPTAAQYVALNAVGYGDWLTSPAVGRWFGLNPGAASSSIFFPASGRRSGAPYDVDGLFRDVTTKGHTWSSSILAGNSGRYLYFTSSFVLPENGNSRFHGLPVRCVSPVP